MIIDKFIFRNMANMKSRLFAAVLLYILSTTGCNAQTKEIESAPKNGDVGKIDLYDKSAVNVIDTNATIQIIGRNYTWSEGPVWIAAKQMLLFSDVRQNRIYQWNMKDTPVLYLTPSGYTDTAFRNGENGSNGLAIDNDGKLLLCQSGD